MTTMERLKRKAIGHHLFCARRLAEITRLARYRHGDVLPDNEEGRVMLEEILIATKDAEEARIVRAIATMAAGVSRPQR
jgi:hypothetical protein